MIKAEYIEKEFVDMTRKLLSGHNGIYYCNENNKFALLSERFEKKFMNITTFEESKLYEYVTEGIADDSKPTKPTAIKWHDELYYLGEL